VRLEPWGPADRPLLDVLLGDPAMTEHLGGPETAEQLDRRQSRYEVPGSRQYKIVVDGQAVGWVGYWEKDWQNEPVWETGWAVAPALQGRGVATTAMQALLVVISAEAESRAVHAFPSVDNPPSNAVCRKVGFQLDGEFDFEYPPGHPLRCNDWVLGLARGQRDA
jgi:RimJ/RimL family protein N-acetyltransferase